METRLAKISDITFGLGGYQECMIGLHVTLEGKGWGVGATESAWDAEKIKHTVRCKWTEKDRNKQYAEIMRYVSKLLKQAKVDSIDKLKNIPVEVTMDGNLLKSWRILEEVL